MTVLAVTLASVVGFLLGWWCAMPHTLSNYCPNRCPICDGADRDEIQPNGPRDNT